jgi:hypothetical protein
MVFEEGNHGGSSNLHELKMWLLYQYNCNVCNQYKNYCTKEASEWSNLQLQPFHGRKGECTEIGNRRKKSSICPTVQSSELIQRFAVSFHKEKKEVKKVNMVNVLHIQK